MSAAFAFERASATPRGTPGERAARSARTAAPAITAIPESVCLSLDEAQRWFQTVITHPESVDAGAREAGLPVEAVVVPGAAIDALGAIGVYHYAYHARLVECLVDDYPALAHALGHERFESLAREYIARHPSRSPNLNAYGQHMATFCSERSEGDARFWADLARLEWALVEMIHAEDAEPLAADELSRIEPAAWASARLLPSDTLRVLRFSYPVNAFYKAFKYGTLEE
ncbi:MAG TPA: putative DNA-binding domain-containing protein, partial [Labilithrix sp.]|nr:putative DNA-binding domain-containing protein [Labilithrix sp.]